LPLLHLAGDVALCPKGIANGGWAEHQQGRLVLSSC